jgi:hypothetical protein
MIFEEILWWSIVCFLGISAFTVLWSFAFNAGRQRERQAMEWEIGERAYWKGHTAGRREEREARNAESSDSRP